MKLQPIGIVHSPHKQHRGTPVQAAFAEGSIGTVEIAARYAAGLKDLAGFERIWLITWLDRAATAELEVTPYLDTETHGIFATRSPCRPNPIGLSPVRLLRIEGAMLHVADLDLLDGTPLLDVKPYVPQFDVFRTDRIGWYARIDEQMPKVADQRFAAP